MVKCLEIWHSYMRKWKTPQSLSCLTKNMIVSFNSVTQTMMLDKIHKFQSIELYGSKTKTIQPNLLPQRADKMCIKKYHFMALCALCQIEMMITELRFVKKLGMLNI